MLNVVTVLFSIESEGYQAFTEISQNAVTPDYTVGQAVLLKKEAGRLVSLDEFDTGVDTTDDMAKGTVIGSLVGILGGPLGVLLGAGIGSLAGSLVDLDDAEEGASMIEHVASDFVDGDIAIIALVDEKDEAAFDLNVAKFDAIIIRQDSDSVGEELDRAREAEAEMERIAREKLRAEKRAKEKAELDAAVAQAGQSGRKWLEENADKYEVEE